MTTHNDRFPYIAHHTDKASFIGEAILDESMNKRDPGLYNLVGLNHDEWSIVGIHTAPANSYNARGYVTILAIDRSKLDDAQDRLGGLAGARALEVVKFETSLTFEDIVSVMKTSSIFYKSKGLKDAEFYVSEVRELPAKN